MIKRLLPLLITLFASLSPSAQVYRVAQMNADQIRAMDKQRTVVILVGGILEEHGPHLPSFTDGYSNEWLAQRLADAIVERTGRTVLIFPTIPLGHGGANEIANKHVFPGTYSVRRTTLRAVFMDLATELGEQGFRNIFVVHGHGAPFHNLMLDQACAYFRDTYGGMMVHLRGLLPTTEQMAKLKLVAPDLKLSEAAMNEIGAMDEHAGFEETSRVLFLRPDLVDSSYRNLLSRTTNDPAEFFTRSLVPDWPGYLGSPRLATARFGAVLQHYRSARDNALALAILEGVLDERQIPRYSAVMTGNSQMMTELSGAARNEMERERQQREWLRKNGIDY